MRRAWLIWASRGAGALVFLGFALLIGHVAHQSWTVLGSDFLTRGPSRFPGEAGVWPALAGTLWLFAVTAAGALPVAVGTAVYLEEYAKPTGAIRVLRSAIANMAGIPSVLFGLVGLAVLVRGLGMGSSVLAAGLTLAALALPTVIIAAQESLRAVPTELREAAYALGATRWQVIRHHLLPHAAPGILTGAVVALTRTVGEAAPLLVLGTLSFVSFPPAGLTDSFTALPTQIFSWTTRPQPGFEAAAAGAIIVLLLILLAMNLLALGIRRRMEVRT